MSHRDDHGLLIVYTGDGKGKTTAALGLCLRAIGHGNKCLVLQFIKSDWEYGELKGVERLAPDVEIRPMGVGCFGKPGDETPREEHEKAAAEALRAAREAVQSERYDVIILDEINIAVHYKLIDIKDLMRMIENRPARVNLVLTGRYADHRVVKAADLVTNMQEVKHPYQKGMLSRKGIDY
jgi:cob(I)alamin adenosyltransferase